VRLLEVDPELARDLPPGQLPEARRRVVAPLVELPVGPWTADGAFVGAHHPFAALVLDGLVIREVQLAGRPAAQLLGSCDLLDAWTPREQPLPAEVTWTIAAKTRLAILDDHFLVASRQWPWLTSRLFERASLRFGRQAAHQAICQLPRVDLRVLALFWHLADSWGTVSGRGVVVHLALTHEAIGRLVGAQRPTVSLALKELSASGSLTRRSDGSWLLAPRSLNALGPAPGARASEAPDVRPLEGDAGDGDFNGLRGGEIVAFRTRVAALRSTDVA
jgi:hypothetical protein